MPKNSKAKPSNRHHVFIGILTVVIGALLLTAVFLYGGKNVVGEAFTYKKASVQVIQQTESIYCENELSLKDSAVKIPEEYQLLSIKLTKAECTGTFMICHYDSIRIMRDVAADYSFCQYNANNPFGCSCIIKQ